MSKKTIILMTAVFMAAMSLFSCKTDKPTSPLTGEDYVITLKTSGDGVANASTLIAKATQVVSLSATADPGYKFVKWESDVEVNFSNAQDKNATFSMPASDVTITAEFSVEATVNGYPITVTYTDGGFASADKDNAHPNDLVTITATQAPGYLFSEWEVIKGDISFDTSAPSIGFTMPNGEVKVKAIFEEDIDILAIVEDQAFRDYIMLCMASPQNGYPAWDTDGDGNLSNAELKEVKYINVEGKGVANMEGIQYFTGIETLIAGGNTFRELNLPENNKITSISIVGGRLAGLDLSGTPNIVTLNCQDCALTYLNLEGCSELTALTCRNCQLTTLNCSDSPKLVSIVAAINKINSVDISNCPDLESIDFENNLLREINISGKTKVRRLELALNQLSAINLDDCRSTLQLLTLQANRLTSLDCSNIPNLYRVRLHENSLTELKLDGVGGQVLELWAHNNCLAAVDITDIGYTDNYVGEYWGMQYNEVTFGGQRDENGTNIDCVLTLTQAQHDNNWQVNYNRVPQFNTRVILDVVPN